MLSELGSPSRKRSREVTGSDLEFKRTLPAAGARGGGNVEAGGQAIRRLWLKSRQDRVRNWTVMLAVGTVRSDCNLECILEVEKAKENYMLLKRLHWPDRCPSSVTR